MLYCLVHRKMNIRCTGDNRQRDPKIKGEENAQTGGNHAVSQTWENRTIGK